MLGVEGLKLNTDKEPEYIHVPASANSPFIRQCFENILREMHNKQDRYAEICQHYLDILILYFAGKTMYPMKWWMRRTAATNATR